MALLANPTPRAVLSSTGGPLRMLPIVDGRDYVAICRDYVAICRGFQARRESSGSRRFGLHCLTFDLIYVSSEMPLPA